MTAGEKAAERDKGDRLTHVAEGQSAMRLQSEYKRELLEIDNSLERDRHMLVMENERLMAEAKRTAEQKKLQMSRRGLSEKKEVDARLDATLTTGVPDEVLPEERDAAGPAVTDANAQYTREMAAIEEETANAIREAEEERDHLIREAAAAAGEEQEHARQQTLEKKMEAEEKMKGAEEWLKGKQ